MALYLQYGNYRHLLGEVDLSVQRQTRFSEAERPIEEQVSWTISARAEGDTLPLLLAELVKVNLAYQARNQYPVARLLSETGAVVHELNGPRSIAGIKVVQPPSFGSGRGAEFTTYANYTVRLEAEFFVGDPATALVSFQESLSFGGGHPERGLLTLSAGRPVEFVSARQTPYRCTQSIRAVGLTAYPTWAVRPAFSLALLEGPDHPATFDSPRARNSRDTHFGLSKTFRFASATPLVGVPRPFPRS